MHSICRSKVSFNNFHCSRWHGSHQGGGASKMAVKESLHILTAIWQDCDNRKVKNYGIIHNNANNKILSISLKTMSYWVWELQ